MRGGLSKGRPVPDRVFRFCRARAQGDHRLPREGRDGEVVLVRLVHGAQKGTAHRAQSQDGNGSSDLSAPCDGVQAVGDPEAADQWQRRRRD